MTESATVARPIADVFALVADFGRLAEWDRNVVRSELIAGAPLEPGARFDVGVRFLGVTAGLVYELVAVSAPTHVEYLATGSTLTSRDAVDLTPTHSGTRVDFRADVELRGYGRLLGPLIRIVSTRQATAALAGLRRALE